MTTEIWKDITKHPDYIVSNFGNVGNRHTGRILSQHKRPGGYAQIHLYRGNTCTTVRVHILVAEAFLGPRPDGYEVNHKDFDKTNSRSDNLEYVTPKQNSVHAYAGGHVGNVFLRGEANRTSRLLETDVREIRDLWSARIFSQRELGKIYGVVVSHIGRIVRRVDWKHI